jgi:segregation and condensation protein B
VAYRQPITRAEIEDVRGVAVSTNIMRTLLERNWVRVVGHRDVPGKPAMFGTTRDFLDYFGLKRLEDLPPLAELKDGLPELHPQGDFIEAIEVADGEGDSESAVESEGLATNLDAEADDSESELGAERAVIDSEDEPVEGGAEVQIVISHAAAIEADLHFSPVGDDENSTDDALAVEAAAAELAAEILAENGALQGADVNRQGPVELVVHGISDSSDGAAEGNHELRAGAESNGNQSFDSEGTSAPSRVAASTEIEGERGDSDQKVDDEESNTDETVSFGDEASRDDVGNSNDDASRDDGINSSDELIRDGGANSSDEASSDDGASSPQQADRERFSTSALEAEARDPIDLSETDPLESEDRPRRSESR